MTLLIAKLAVTLLLAMPVAWLAQSVAPAASAGVPKYRVVMQVSNAEPRGWHQTLNNAMAGST